MFGKKKRGKKFCPQCGAELNPEDKFCTSCRYSFEKRKSRLKLRNIILIIIILIIAFFAVRYYLGKPLIPNIPYTEFLKNLTGFGK